MAIFRKIHTSFWSDTFIQDLDNDQRLFYLYLLTNERTKQCGIYEISKKQMAFDLGYSIDRVSKLLQYFIKVDKVLYNDSTKELAIKNWGKYNNSSSPKVVSCIKSELNDVKDRVLIEYINGMYTASQEEEEEEQEQEEEQEDNFEEVWSAYGRVGNKKTSKDKWKTLKPKERDEIQKHIPIYINNHKSNDKLKYIPHFTTYLNQRRWEDELPYQEINNKFEIKNLATLDDD